MAPDPSQTPLWLSHHHPEHHDRCVSIGGLLVCRRCAVLYPLIVLAAALTLAVGPTTSVAVAAMWLLPLPMSLDWVLEQRGSSTPSPRRLTAVSALAALGIGAALAAHLRQPFDPDAVAAMATHFTICGVSSVFAARRRPASDPSSDWERRHARAEARRDADLRALLIRDDRDLGTE